MFVIVARTAIKHRRKKAEANGTSTISLILRLIGVTFLLGLTWVFGGLTVVSETSLAFQILFAIFNSSQGFFLFLFFCVLNKDARVSWRRILCRGRYNVRQTFQSHTPSHIKGRYPLISSSGTGSTSQHVTLRKFNSDLQFTTSEQVVKQISSVSEISAFGEVYGNPLTESSVGDRSGDNEITSEGTDQNDVCNADVVPSSHTGAVSERKEPFEMVRNDAYTAVTTTERNMAYSTNSDSIPAAWNMAYAVTELQGGNALNREDSFDSSHDAYTAINPSARNMAYVETELEGGTADLNTNDGSHAVYEELHKTVHNQSMEHVYDYAY